MAWDQTFDEEIADFDSVTPAWDNELDAVADFDAEQDDDNDLNDHADAVHDGAVGLEITFDDNTAAYGTLNFDAVDQTTACVSFWLNYNDVNWEDGKYIFVVYGVDGGAAGTFAAYMVETASAPYLYIAYYTDAPALTVMGAVPLTSGWHHIMLQWAASTGVGNDDGWMRAYKDGVLTLDGTGHDNDTQDVDVVHFGNFLSNHASPSGSFYIDTIKIDPVGGPFVSELGAQSGTYGMVIPIMDATARYGQLSDAVADTFTTVDFQLDLNALTMATNDQFTIAKCDGEFTVELKYTGSVYQVQLALTTDGGTDATSWYTITDASHTIRVVWNAATGVGENDGYAQLFVDDVLQEQILGLDTDTLDVDEVQYGAIAGLDAGTYGVIYFDNCQWNDALTQSAQAGVFEASGTVTKKTADSHAGVLTYSGTVSKKPKKPLAGVVTFVGAVVAKAKKALAGTITFSGTSVLEKLWLKLFARFRDYTFNALKRFTISSSAVVRLASYRDYTFNAPKRGEMSTAQDIWLEGTPFYLVEGSAPKITAVFNWASTITGTPTVEVYKDKSSTDTAGTYMPSGSVTTSGNSLTTKALAVLVPGKYVIVINAVVDGVTDVWKAGFVVQKQEALW